MLHYAGGQFGYGGYVARRKGSADIGWIYSFMLPESNGNDNELWFVMMDTAIDDAEISMNRHFYPHDWRDDWELVKVDIVVHEDLNSSEVTKD